MSLLVLSAVLVFVVFVVVWHRLRAAGLVERVSPSRTSRQTGPAEGLTPTWRDDPFLIGHRYRVRTVLPPPSSQNLSQGEILTYQGSGYSRYDGASIYYFLTESGEARQWWLYDDDSIDQHPSLFAPAGMN